jgi:MFS family permease
MGLAVAAASQVPSTALLALAWLGGGAANGLLNVGYETLLQERTPDHVRGRVFAACEAVMDIGMVGGLLLAGAVAAALGTRGSYALAGVLLVVSAALAILVLRTRRPAPAAVPRDAVLAE